MSSVKATVISLAICIAAAAIEGLCAGNSVKAYFSKLRWPRLSPPLWVWYIIGVIYYATFLFVLYQVLRHESSTLRTATFILIPVMMLLNGIWNYLLFRMRHLFLSFVTTMFAPIPDVVLFLCLVQLDTTAALALPPYLVYRLYSLWWSYGVWQLNRSRD
jgi:translocator protein